VDARFLAPVQTGPGAHPTSCTVGTGSFPEVKIGQSVTLTPHPLLVPWSRKNRAIFLLPLWAVRIVQGCNYFYTRNGRNWMACLEVEVWKLGGIRREAGKGNFLLLSDHDDVRLIHFGGPETEVGNESLGKG